MFREPDFVTARPSDKVTLAFFSYVVVGLSSTWLLAFPMGLGNYGIVLSFSVSLFMAATLLTVERDTAA